MFLKLFPIREPGYPSRTEDEFYMVETKGFCMVPCPLKTTEEVMDVQKSSGAWVVWPHYMGLPEEDKKRTIRHVEIYNSPKGENMDIYFGSGYVMSSDGKTIDRL